MHLNINGIKNKIENLELFLDETPMHVVSINEHGLKDINVKSFCLLDYTVASYYARENNKKGGVMLFVKNYMRFSDVTLVNISETFHFEYCAVKLLRENITVISIYRSPSGNIEIFFEKLELLLNYHKNCTNLVICGDFNIDVTKNDTKKKKFINLLKSYNLFITITSSTRVTSESETCIDNFCTNLNFCDIKTVNVPVDFSDHNLIHIHIKMLQKQSFKKNYFEYRRSFTRINIENFVYKLSLIDWQHVYVQSDPVDKFDSFYNILLRVFEVSFPIRKIFINKTKPWITKGIRKSSKTKKELYLLTKIFPNSVLTRYYIRYSFILKNLVKKAKELHYNDIIQKSNNVAKSTWQVIKQETNNSFKQVSQNNNFEINTDSSVEINPSKIAEIFNNYFSDIAAKLLKDVPGDFNYIKMLENVKLKENSSIFLAPVDSSEVKKIINNLKNSAAVGVDGIPIKIIKSAKEILASPIADVINCCFEQGYFPEVFKTAKIIPLHKKGNKHDKENFRPISILPSLSKIFEALLKNSLSQFFEKNNILCSNQHGFRTNKSTTSAIENILNFIITNINSSNFVSSINLDLSKAFDLIDHDILLEKLEYYGIRGNVQKLLSSYLKNRNSVVEITQVCDTGEIKKYYSSRNEIKHGVPQGSILGPLLFIIFINDLPSNSKFNITMYADDTNILISDTSLNGVVENLHLSLRDVTSWFSANKLILNLSKTNVMFFPSFIKPHVPEIKFLDKHVLHLASSCSLLGIELDDKFSWSCHIDKLLTKLHKTIFVLSRMKKISNVQTLKIIYYSCFESHLKYGLLLWGNSGFSDKAFKLQKKALRIIANLNCRDSCRSSFITYRVMTLANLYIFEALLFTYKTKNSINTNSQFHSYNTRNCNLLKPDYPSTTLYKKSYIYNGIKFFNRLPELVKSAPSSAVFKKIIKKYLTNNVFYTVEEYLSI